jgi:hypothetical protein
MLDVCVVLVVFFFCLFCLQSCCKPLGYHLYRSTGRKSNALFLNPKSMLANRCSPWSNVWARCYCNHRAYQHKLRGSNKRERLECVPAETLSKGRLEMLYRFLEHVESRQYFHQFRRVDLSLRLWICTCCCRHCKICTTTSPCLAWWVYPKTKQANPHAEYAHKSPTCISRSFSCQSPVTNATAKVERLSCDCIYSSYYSIGDFQQPWMMHPAERYKCSRWAHAL